MTKFQKIILVLIIFIAGAFRFYKLDVNPPSLYWDEVAFGYDAYSILNTARDHRGHFLPLFFESFGDWKLPGYFYLLVPSVKIFGLNEFAVRFPSAFLSTSTVFLLFILVRQLSKNTKLALISSFFLAISPWHIQFARGGFESSAGLFFVVLATILFINGLAKKSAVYFLISFLFIALSIYTYHAYRVFSPLFLLALLIIFYKESKNNLKQLLVAFMFLFLIIIPMVIFTFTSSGQSRAISESAFKKEDAEKAKLEYDQKSKKPFRFLSGYLFKKPVYFTQVAFLNYIDHFSPKFLFFKGDQIGRHSQVDMGQIYIFDSILLVLALFGLKRLNHKTTKVFIAWLVLGPIPAVIVTPTPHAYRTLQMVIPLAYFSAAGAYYFFTLKRKILLKFSLLVVIAYSIATYLHLLLIHYPDKFSPDWQDGYKQAVKLVGVHETNYDKVYITNINNVPYIYFLFFNKYEPQKYLNENGTSKSFGKYVFTSDNFDLYNKGKILYLAPSWKDLDGKIKGSVFDSAGRHLYTLWEVGGSYD